MAVLYWTKFRKTEVSTELSVEETVLVLICRELYHDNWNLIHLTFPSFPNQESAECG